MGRVAQNKVKTLIVALAVVLAAAGITTWAVIANSSAHRVDTGVNTQNQLDFIKYHGKNGVDALTLLKKHATVQAKHYSFGDLVTSINGSTGNGPKYWTFYINGKEAQTGASSYISKNADTLQWRLQ